MKTANRTTPKTSLTLKPYFTTFKGYEITVPAGWPVSNVTACGPDDSYRFAGDPRKLAALVTGQPDSILAHDLTHYGLNLPADVCEPWSN